MSVRVRFAPSPTGHVHIGNIRVAIFNWLFARHERGAFLLRVEDTDRERSTDAAVQTLLASMEWLGLDYDESPLYQSTRRDAHVEAANRLLEQGLAYREDKGGTGKGEATVFRMPEGDLVFQDALRGELRKPAADVQDMVIVRSDGSPVFHLANVVDDIEMGITHVIRGDDHIENTYRHAALYRALGAPVPVFCHLPMIVNHQGKPYSKRDGDAFVGEFRERGVLPDALFNYLALLGWSPGDDEEVMSRETMVNRFTLDRINLSAGQMDLNKLMWMNGEYIRKLPPDVYREQFVGALQSAGLLSGDEEPEYLARAAALMQERTKCFADISADAGFFVNEDYPFDAKASRKRLMKDDVPGILQDITAALEALADFSESSVEACVREFAEQRGIQAAQVVHPLRVSVSGLAHGPGLFEMLALLGKERVCARITRALAHIKAAE